MADEISARPDASDARTNWFTAGGILGALLVSSCCLLPLAFVLLGVSGAWIANLTALEPYRPYFGAVALAFIGLGFWQVYFRRKPDCAGDSYCARPRNLLITKTVLWIATVLVLLSLTTNWWAPYFY